MTTSVLLDTSFLIALAHGKHPHHTAAEHYYRYMLEQQMLMYLSVISVGEFARRQPITDLPLKNFRTLPFNVQHAIKAAELAEALPMAWVNDDIKLLAQAAHEAINFVLTDEATSLYQRAEQLRMDGYLRLRSIQLADGFEVSSLREDGQRGLNLSL